MVRVNVDRETSVIKTFPEVKTEQSVFFAPSQGWSAAEKRGAFVWYLGHLSAAGTNGMTRFDESVACAAITQCKDMDYTNSVPMIEEISRMSVGRPRNVAVRTLVAWRGVDDGMTTFVCSVLTNRDFYGVGLVRDVSNAYVDKVIAADTSTPEALAARDRAVEMFYRTRGDIDRAWGVDEVLAACLPLYAVSSNRLAFLESAIDSTNCYPRARERFIGITNELHQTGGPLLFRTRKFYDWEE